MKQVFTAISFLLLALFVNAQQQQSLASVSFKNNSFLPKKMIVISYAPEEFGNSTTMFYLFPFITKTIKFKPGTKLYLATQKQVNIVMSGKRLDAEAPTYVVSAVANKQTISIL